MTRLDKVVLAVVVALAFELVKGWLPFSYAPEVGRRPQPIEGAHPAVPSPPMPERVRRPPLAPPAASDPVVAIAVEPAVSGTYMLGTAFSIDPRGVWITARHVAGEDCQRVVVLLSGHSVPATAAYRDAEADLVVLKTASGAPAMPFSGEQPSLGERGFSFGYPGGDLGATQASLMGRARMRLSGRLSGTTPTLVWAEVQRVPDTLPSLGGMSGGPMLDDGGGIVGEVVAASARRGRIETVAPETLSAGLARAGIAAPSPPPVAEIARVAGDIGAVAGALSANARIAKVYCAVR